MNKTEATKNPFVSKLVHDGKFLRTEGNQPFYDGIIADLRTWNTPLEGYQAKDRADYVCKAVNNHEQLLEACREALIALEHGGVDCCACSTCEMLQNAINQASKQGERP
jgi:ferredoxin